MSTAIRTARLLCLLLAVAFLVFVGALSHVSKSLTDQAVMAPAQFSTSVTKQASAVSL